MSSSDHIGDPRWASAAAAFGASAVASYALLRVVAPEGALGVTDGGIPYFWRCSEALGLGLACAGVAGLLPEAAQRRWLGLAPIVLTAVVAASVVLMVVFP